MPFTSSFFRPCNVQSGIAMTTATGYLGSGRTRAARFSHKGMPRAETANTLSTRVVEASSFG